MTAPRPIQHPTPAQIEAADPQVSAWVGANAGSGKTRVLTQRVARLLLAGADPQHILCLTFTKAAAAEMQNRLYDMLGGWAMAPDDWLAAELAAIAGAKVTLADPEALAEARRLFARALETPGGLKIQTIHAFCDALLRRFPLEAGVSPRFEVLDDRQSALMIAAIRAQMAAAAESGTDPGFDGAAERLNEDALDDLLGAVLAKRSAFPEGDDIDTRLAANFDPVALQPAEAVAQAALARLDRGRLTAYAARIAEGSKADSAVAAAITAARAAADPTGAAELLAAAFTTQKGEPRSRHNFPTKGVLKAWPDAGAFTDEMIAWAQAFLADEHAREAAARARDLDGFATSLLTRYRAAKTARALLDFDDLIDRAAGLLTGPGMAAWALYRLDKGIDHILVDEAQDTAPAQWQVIRTLADEFHSGASARTARRTLFVVGDEKQSIYSFQGAEPAAFGRNRTHFAEWLEGMGSRLARPDLITSFRSAPGILAFVDAVFAGDAAHGLTIDDDPVTHVAHRARDAARVDLWPLVEPDPAEDPPEWWEPVDVPKPGSAKARLARILAAEIKRMTDEDRLPARDGRPGRPVRPGDILVLVARRDALARGLIRELKGLGLAVAGADRLSLAGELAVMDLMALVKVAITPGDELSLAALLRSPLCGLSEDDLFALAHDRPTEPRGGLWAALMAARERHPKVAAMLADMARHADFLRPYEFLERALIRHDGRRRLLSRLGREAEDPIDELLAQALAYETREAPSLAGFIAWIEAGEIMVKREMEHGQDEVRVMTVHGAKGLEAPIVILPDTMAQREPGANKPQLYPVDGDGNKPPLVLWAGARAGDDALTGAAREAATARAAAERKRLLYVALTRAEDWLVLCGAGLAARKEGTWYEALEQGLDRLGGDVARPAPDPLGQIRRHEANPVPVAGAPTPPVTVPAAPRPDRPGWLGPTPHEERPPRLSPSGLGDHDEVGGTGLGRDLALMRGTAVHRLLELLPQRPAADRAALAGRLLAEAFPGLPAELAPGVVAEALAVLAAPFAAELFGPDSLAEPGFAQGPEPGSMRGRIDRLVIRLDRVLVVDFKTDAQPPATPDGVPPAYLAQLGAYHSALAAIWPERPVEAAILWTRGPSLMRLDPARMAAALHSGLAHHK